MGTMTLEERIRSANHKNIQLLKTLSETDWVTAAHHQNSSYINTLKKDISKQEINLKRLSAKVMDEFQDYRKYRDSHMKRLAYRARGKNLEFQAQASKEEREWLEAVQEELKANNNLEQLQKQLAEANRTADEIYSVLRVRTDSGLELDELYNSVFEGPTPGFADEDAQERLKQQADQEFNIVSLQLSFENQVQAILLDADKFLQRALADVNEALEASDYDVWGVGGQWADMAERSALGKAQAHASQVEMLISQAQRIQPAVGAIGPMPIAQGNFMSDIMFDNIFSDLAFHDKIQDSMVGLQRAQRALKIQINAAGERKAMAQSEADQAKKLLDTRRKELQDMRALAFERVAAGGGLSGYEGAPPEYEE